MFLVVRKLFDGFQFQGQYVDDETGLHYNRNRHYDPISGRYITPDPIGLAGGTNVYRYGNANPAQWVDPLGLTTCPMLYRGVRANHPAIGDAKNGIVQPANPKANISPEAHAEGGLTGQSQYVSWTPNKDLALSHANKDGPGGIMLSVPRGAPSEGDAWAWGWTHINDWGEPEMLQTGTRTGVNVSREGCL
ncbi:RHS repeat-associated core domain-containing protein [Caballeronia sp. INDeC2]|uniref:RHS repeat-associated core domain-containing protein n=1 Tax=Caballeronia sp. INDeC2 TaxID=2921747 RepID=UPI0032EB60FA